MKSTFVLYYLILFWKSILCDDESQESEPWEPGQYDYDPETRIVGGKIVKIRQYPYMAQISVLGIRICGGSIIASNWILTAGHCIHRFSVREMSIRVGTERSSIGGVDIKVKKKIEHPNYNDATLDYDIGLIKLVRNIPDNNKSARPVRLPAMNEFPKPGTFATVSGWGAMDDNSFIDSEELRAVSLPILSSNECQKWYSGIENIKDFVICSGYEAGQKDACVGDSGGPLVIQQTQVGIVSWGIGCARPRTPGVYTNVANPSIRSFIKKTTGL